MKKLTTIFIFTLVTNFIYSQECYINLVDASGIDMSEYQTELETKACELRESFPSEYQSQFNVYDFGFYSLNENMQGGFQGVWDKMLNKVKAQSKYYLLIGRQPPDSKGNTKTWVDLKIPEEWLLKCFDPAYVKVLKTTIKNKFNNLSSSGAYDFADVQIEGMQFMAEKISYLSDCCQPNLRSGNSCEGCVTSKDVYNELINLGFTPFALCDIQNPDVTTDQSCLCSSDAPTATKSTKNTSRRSASEITDLAAHTITVDGQAINLENQLSKFAGEISGQDFSGFITKNSTFCTPQTFADFEARYQESSIAAWIHVFEVPDSLGQDVLFVKSKYVDTEQIAPKSIKAKQIQADPSPPFEYTVLHRSFAPWDRFGHLPIAPDIHIARNSFRGDNRGFSLEDPTRTSPGTTAKINQIMKIKLGKGKLPLSNESIFSSKTIGYENFRKREPRRIIPHPYKQELDHWEYVPTQEKEDFCNPSGFENTLIKDNITYAAMFFEGSDPLIVFPMIAPDVEWYLELGFYYTSSESALNISGRVIGKSFPAYEAYIEDKCGNKMFLYTYAAPCESDLAIELLNPFPDHNKGFDIAVKVDDNGCFLSELTTTYDGTSQDIDMQSWNQQNLSKAAAQDCPSNPCQGAYPNDGSDKRNDFNCGN